MEYYYFPWFYLSKSILVRY